MGKNEIWIFIILIAFISCRRDVSPERRNEDMYTSLIDSLAQFDKTEASDSVLPAPVRNFIWGYTDHRSYFPGDSMRLLLNAPDTLKNVGISLLDVNGAQMQRIYTTIKAQKPNTNKPWLNGDGLAKTTTVLVNPTLKSGFYTWNGNIPFVVKKPRGAASSITVVYPSNTQNAYCYDGGKGLYKPTVKDRSYVASFLRYQPIDKYSINFLKWISTQAYDVNYICDEDLEDFENLQNTQVLLIIGHSEYWTRQARQNFDRFVDGGKNALVLGGNTMWWQVRYNNAKNLMICYKDKGVDPIINRIYSTFNWPDSTLLYPTTKSLGVDFVRGGFGNILPNRWDGYKIIKPTSPLLSGTGLLSGQILKNPTYEYDGAPLTKPIVPGSTDIPRINNNILKFQKVELIGYDFTKTTANGTGVATFMVFKKSLFSGTVVNTGSEGWCENIGVDASDKVKIQTITKNMIDLSLSKSNLFAP